MQGQLGFMLWYTRVILRACWCIIPFIFVLPLSGLSSHCVVASLAGYHGLLHVYPIQGNDACWRYVCTGIMSVRYIAMFEWTHRAFLLFFSSFSFSIPFCFFFIPFLFFFCFFFIHLFFHSFFLFFSHFFLLFLFFYFLLIFLIELTFIWKIQNCSKILGHRESGQNNKHFWWIKSLSFIWGK